MPNIKSSKKRVLIAQKKTAQNRIFKSGLKTAMKKANAAAATGASDSTEAIRVAIRRVDQAVAKNLMHKNTASRRKSALMKKLAAAQ